MQPSIGVEVFYSDAFNALAALNDVSLVPPRNIKPLASFRECRFLLPPSHEDYLSVAVEGEKQKERKAKREDNQFRVVNLALPDEGPGFVQQLDGVAVGTTMECLVAWKEARIAVHLRGPQGLKSVVQCKLLAFDKHFNLLVTDAVETTVTKRQRRLVMTIIKGDSVILIQRLK
jgi:small nuclear ribonucleoprotein (snRNP)-like protein